MLELSNTLQARMSKFLIDKYIQRVYNYVQNSGAKQRVSLRKGNSSLLNMAEWTYCNIASFVGSFESKLAEAQAADDDSRLVCKMFLRYCKAHDEDNLSWSGVYLLILLQSTILNLLADCWMSLWICKRFWPWHWNRRLSYSTEHAQIRSWYQQRLLFRALQLILRQGSSRRTQDQQHNVWHKTAGQDDKLCGNELSRCSSSKDIEREASFHSSSTCISWQANVLQSTGVLATLKSRSSS